jgi:hypothetical protein
MGKNKVRCIDCAHLRGKWVFDDYFCPFGEKRYSAIRGSYRWHAWPEIKNEFGYCEDFKSRGSFRDRIVYFFTKRFKTVPLEGNDI